MIVVWFSCGAASAVAAKLTVDRYDDVRIVYNPVVEEHEDNLRFLNDVSAWIDHPIEIAHNPKFPNSSAVEVWDRRRYMSGVAGAPCTMLLKKDARKHWEMINQPDFHVLGFTVDEQRRHDRFVRTERSNVIPVLIDAGMSKQDCMDYLISAEIDPPQIYRLGFPNANCIGCVKATSPTYWNHVRETFPSVFKARSDQSREIGARLVEVKGQRIFLDQLDPSARGRPLRSMKFECGIFCEEEI